MARLFYLNPWFTRHCVSSLFQAFGKSQEAQKKIAIQANNKIEENGEKPQENACPRFSKKALPLTVVTVVNQSGCWLLCFAKRPVHNHKRLKRFSVLTQSLNHISFRNKQETNCLSSLF